MLENILEIVKHFDLFMMFQIILIIPRKYRVRSRKITIIENIPEVG